MRLLRDLQSVLTAACGLALACSFIPGQRWLAFVSVVAGSYFAVRSAYVSIRRREVDVNLLMVLAAAGAVGIGRKRDAAALLFLFSLSSTLESHAMARTRHAIESLIRLRPDTATKVVAGKDTEVPVEDLQIGDLIRIAPFHKIPADAKVEQGQTTVDQSSMTGESIPEQKRPGDTILAGTQNLDTMILASVLRRNADSTLERIVHLVRDAQENKASGERISQWFGRTYTLFVLAAFGLSLLIRSFLDPPFITAFHLSLTLLVALSPCALVISTPATTLSALAWAARNGMLVRGGEFIERAGAMDTLALDKTGTLTLGKPSLVEICVCSGAGVHAIAGSAACAEEEACWSTGESMSPESQSILRLAAAAEQYSSHPIAEAIVQAARDQSLDIPEALDQRDVPGFGVQANIEDQPVKIGKRGFFESGHPLPPEFLHHVDQMQELGRTVSIVQVGDRFAALGLSDEPRPEAQDFLRRMKKLGAKRILMLTGDTQVTADAIANRLGIQEVRAALLPDAKTEVIRRLTEEGASVIMVGDGINDAPSLAAAKVGVAMGGLGSDIALSAADVVLMRDRLDGVPNLVALGRSTNRVVRANLFFAAGMIVALTIGSLLAVLPLPLAVIGHEGSTVVVILNGLRMLNGPGRAAA